MQNITCIHPMGQTLNINKGATNEDADIDRSINALKAAFRNDTKLLFKNEYDLCDLGCTKDPAEFPLSSSLDSPEM